MNELKIISVNVRGLNTYEKRVKIYDWLSDSKKDIAILQETHYVERNITKYDARWFWKNRYIHFQILVFQEEFLFCLEKDLDIENCKIHTAL